MLTKCKICVAKTAGFCFGVDRAVKIVYNELDNRNNVVTLGPIIHNPNVVSDLEAKGVYSTDVDKVTKDQTVVIRSHGVGLDVYEKLAKVGAEVIDATCPFVARIQSSTLLRVLATKGSPKRVDAGEHHVVVSHIEEHSRKPGEVHERIRRLMGDVPKIELFARRKAEGFDVWGNEVDSDIEFKGGNRLCS